eukprot:11032720-Karenia_brevis.AAC.1
MPLLQAIHILVICPSKGSSADHVEDVDDGPGNCIGMDLEHVWGWTEKCTPGQHFKKLGISGRKP